MRWYPDRIPDFITKLFQGLVWHKDRSEKTVYFTFDDGPTPVVTDFVLSTLEKFNFKATFFCIGDCVDRNEEVFARIKREGHAVGNHTFNHLNAWKTGTSVYLENIQKADGVISSTLFRPPYGKITPALSSRIKSMGYDIVMWDVLSGDFDQNRSAASCLKNVIENTTNGSIVVFHDSVKAQEKLFEILPQFCKSLKDRGFKAAALN